MNTLTFFVIKIYIMKRTSYHLPSHGHPIGHRYRGHQPKCSYLSRSAEMPRQKRSRRRGCQWRTADGWCSRSASVLRHRCQTSLALFATVTSLHTLLGTHLLHTLLQEIVSRLSACPILFIKSVVGYFIVFLFSSFCVLHLRGTICLSVMANSMFSNPRHDWMHDWVNQN